VRSVEARFASTKQNPGKVTDMTRFTGTLVVAVCAAAASLAVVHAQGKGKADPNLMTIAKSGQVLRTPKTMAIYWGSGWNNPAVAGDIITGMDSFFTGISGSHFAELASEYGDRNGTISPLSVYLGHVLDPTEPPAGALSNSAVIAEACQAAGNNPDPNGVYFVFTSTAASLPGTCAIRTWGTCGAKRLPIQAVYAPYMTGTDAQCHGVLDNGDDGSVTGHSTALGQYGNVAANQFMNAITDPNGNGWKDAIGDGISFKCDGIFIPAGNFEQFSNASLWTVRMKWSNAAYQAGTGALNHKNLPGCVY
jgi:hypothetical protein